MSSSDEHHLLHNVNFIVQSDPDAYGDTESDTDAYGDTDTAAVLTDTCACAPSTSTSTSSSRTSTSQSQSSSTPRSRKGSSKAQGLIFFRLSKKLKDEDSALEFAKDIGLVANKVKCPTCNQELESIYKVRKGGRNKSELRFHFPV